RRFPAMVPFMGLFNVVKRALGGGGGVAAKLSAPKSFSWADGSIPLTVSLRGHGSEPRTVSELRFRLQDDDQGDDRGDVVDASWVHAEPFELAPGASHSVTLDMPLPFDLEAIEAAIPATDASTSLTERLLTGLVAGAARPPEHVRHYKVSLNARVNGAKLGATASTSIRYSSAWRSETTISL